jgi:hypothetical protein
VLGGQFAWRQGSAGAPASVHYFGPDDLTWQDLRSGYSDWLYSMLTGAADQFYASLRWPGWQDEVHQCRLDQGISTFPPPWTTEGKDLGLVSRRAVPMMELASLHRDMARRF